MNGLMPDLSSLGGQRSEGQSSSWGEASGSEMPLMLPQRDELEKVRASGHQLDLLLPLACQSPRIRCKHRRHQLPHVQHIDVLFSSSGMFGVLSPIEET